MTACVGCAIRWSSSFCDMTRGRYSNSRRYKGGPRKPSCGFMERVRDRWTPCTSFRTQANGYFHGQMQHYLLAVSWAEGGVRWQRCSDSYPRDCGIGLITGSQGIDTDCLVSIRAALYRTLQSKSAFWNEWLGLWARLQIPLTFSPSAANGSE